MSKSRSELLGLALGVENDQPLVDVPAPVEINADELLAPLPTVSEIRDEAVRADVVAEKLEEIAEKAELLAEQDQATVANAEVLQMAVESLMNSHSLPYMTAGMENARDPKMLLLAVSDEARRSAQVLRTYSLESLSYSPEGMLSRLLGFDKRAFAAAREALVRAEKDLAAMSDLTRESRVLINHKGIFQFLAQNGRPVSDIVGSFKADIKWLDDGRAYIDQAFKVLEQAADIIDGAKDADTAGVEAAVKKLEALRLPSATHLERKKGHGLLNNATYVMASSDNSKKAFPNLVCDAGRIEREDITSSDRANGFLRLAGGIAGWYAGGNAGATVGLLFGPVGGAVGGVLGAVAGAKGVINAFNAADAGKSLKSAFGLPELKQMIELAKGLDKHVDFEFAANALDSKLTVKLPTELGKASSTVIHSVVALHSIAEDLYYQAERDLKGVAALAQKVVGAYEDLE